MLHTGPAVTEEPVCINPGDDVRLLLKLLLPANAETAGIEACGPTVGSFLEEPEEEACDMCKSSVTNAITTTK